MRLTRLRIQHPGHGVEHFSGFVAYPVLVAVRCGEEVEANGISGTQQRHGRRSYISEFAMPQLVHTGASQSSARASGRAGAHAHRIASAHGCCVRKRPPGHCVAVPANSAEVCASSDSIEICQIVAPILAPRHTWGTFVVRVRHADLTHLHNALLRGRASRVIVKAPVYIAGARPHGRWGSVEVPGRKEQVSLASNHASEQRFQEASLSGDKAAPVAESSRTRTK